MARTVNGLPLATPRRDHASSGRFANNASVALRTAVNSAICVASGSATEALFVNLPDDAWSRRGVASGNPFTVRAMAFILAGHGAHHLRSLRERYVEG